MRLFSFSARAFWRGPFAFIGGSPRSRCGARLSHPREEDLPRVVVVGAGAAGTMAAIFAASAGADVLLLERTDGWRTKNPHLRRRALQHPARAARRIPVRDRLVPTHPAQHRALVAARRAGRVLRAGPWRAACRRGRIGETVSRVAARAGRPRPSARIRRGPRCAPPDELQCLRPVAIADRQWVARHARIGIPGRSRRADPCDGGAVGSSNRE